MSLFSRFSPSVFSGTNENTLALANFNLDFSLVKVTAPREFAPLGSALSVRRRNEAEDGACHKILRRLGALFEELAPSTPLLVKAYGSRASEIIQTPRVNPQASPADGPFQSFVGADGTSVWAAATSGPASIAVLLLACMLARQFGDSKLSVALWVELIFERKRAIGVTVNDNGIIPASSVIAARQDFDRRDIASLDASVRSWLCTADQAMLHRQTQMMLILKNIPAFLEISNGQSTYDKVILAWRTAMIGIEGLLGGLACEIRDGAILLALSAWHLYPNLTVLSDEVKIAEFKDALFQPSAVVTVGLHGPSGNTEQGMCWSMTLSHLHHYGDPVAVKNEEDNSSVSVSQLSIVMLGSVFAGWSIKSEDAYLAAELVVSLQRFLYDNCRPEDIGRYRRELVWLEVLAPAAQRLLAAQETSDETTHQLFYYGRRRSDTFFKRHFGPTIPLFGFHNIMMLEALTEQNSFECGLRYMRAILSKTECDRSQMLIVQRLKFGGGRPAIIISSALPHIYRSRKRWHDTSEVQSIHHVRWVIQDQLLSGDKSTASILQAWAHGIEERGESVHILEQCETDLLHTQARLFFSRYISAHEPSTYERCPALSSPDPLCRCLEPRAEPDEAMPYSCVFGVISSLALFSRKFHTSAKFSEARIGNFDIRSSIDLLNSGAVKPHLLLRYVSTAATDRYHQVTQAALFGIRDDDLPEQFDGCVEAVSDPLSPSSYSTDNLQDVKPGTLLETLPIHSGDAFDILSGGMMTHALTGTFRVLKIGQVVYEQFGERLVQLKVLSQPLHEVLGLQDWDPNPAWLTPSKAFTCLSTFESCSVSSVPRETMENVMALASGDSIYVSSRILSDPLAKQSCTSLRRIVGNIGHPGVTLLISPTRPRCRPVSEDFRAVQHKAYDFRREDNFGATSLHLLFTEWKMPVDAGNKGFIDHDVHLLEAVVSIRDRGKWVADIDILTALKEEPEIIRWSPLNNHSECSDGNITSVDCWDEVLDPPEGVAIVRAHGNWAARLAAFCVIKQQLESSRIFLIDGDVGCRGCVKYQSTFIID